MADENEEITELIVSDDLLDFEVPSYQQVRSAYSKGFKKKKTSVITHINQIFPKEAEKQEDSSDDEPVFIIEPDDDPLII